MVRTEVAKLVFMQMGTGRIDARNGEAGSTHTVATGDFEKHSRRSKVAKLVITQCDATALGGAKSVSTRVTRCSSVWMSLARGGVWRVFVTWVVRLR